MAVVIDQRLIRHILYAPMEDSTAIHSQAVVKQNSFTFFPVTSKNYAFRLNNLQESQYLDRLKTLYLVLLRTN